MEKVSNQQIADDANAEKKRAEFEMSQIDRQMAELQTKRNALLIKRDTARNKEIEALRKLRSYF